MKLNDNNTYKEELEKFAQNIQHDFPYISKQFKDFIESVEDKKIPKEFPDVDKLDNYLQSGAEMSYEYDLFMLPIYMKEYTNKNGMWQIVSESTTQQLAKKFQGKKVLEVMAGKGWQSKALSEQGIEVKATDNHSWTPKEEDVFKVESISAEKAIELYKDDYDVLLVSWPPYEDTLINDVIKQWGSEKSIIYIGEDKGGCCANNEFFEMIDMQSADVNYKSTRFINDNIYHKHPRAPHP